jgi:hypothetical protein
LQSEQIAGLLSLAPAHGELLDTQKQAHFSGQTERIRE